MGGMDCRPVVSRSSSGLALLLGCLTKSIFGQVLTYIPTRQALEYRVEFQLRLLLLKIVTFLHHRLLWIRLMILEILAK